MPSARQIKRRISASQNISKITKAMEMVAASKMKRAQDQALSSRPYARALEESLARVSEFSEGNLHPLLTPHEQGKDVCILVSTDKGLCGSLNPNLFKQTLGTLQRFERPELIVIGKKAVAFARLWGLPVHAQFTDLPEHISAAEMLPLAAMIIEGYTKQEFKTVSIIYMDFINTLSQKVRIMQLLPVLRPEEHEDSAMVTPEIKSLYAFEPSAAEILSQLLPYYIEHTLFQVMLEARASEHSARMVAMKNASENAKELVSELKLLFNKSRQASITSELLDITTATLSLQ